MRAILLAGGKGTRLLPYTATFPKPLVPLDDVPVIEVLVQQLARYGTTDLTVVTGHLAELIRAFLGNGERYGLQIDYFQESTPLDTAGCLGMLPRPDQPFLVRRRYAMDHLDLRPPSARELDSRREGPSGGDLARRVLVTGAAGFSGHYLIARLRKCPSAILWGLDLAAPATRRPRNSTG